LHEEGVKAIKAKVAVTKTVAKGKGIIKLIYLN
jgi:hypothetical protein